MAVRYLYFKNRRTMKKAQIIIDGWNRQIEKNDTVSATGLKKIKDKLILCNY